jgi:uncharacterized FlaG/YvyC family protein
MLMSDSNQELEPVDVKELMAEYAEMSFADLVLEVKDLKVALEAEKKAKEAATFHRNKAEEELAKLTGRINSSMAILNGEADICIDCEAVKKDKED